MNPGEQHQVLSIISIVAFLVLVLSGWRSHNIGLRQTLYIAGAWAGIFAVAILLFSALGPT